MNRFSDLVAGRNAGKGVDMHELIKRLGTESKAFVLDNISEKTGVPVRLLEGCDHPDEADKVAAALAPLFGGSATKEVAVCKNYPCVKCGDTGECTDVRFIRKGQLGSRVQTLVCTCDRCGYEWDEPTADAPNEKPKETTKPLSENAIDRAPDSRVAKPMTVDDNVLTTKLVQDLYSTLFNKKTDGTKAPEDKINALNCEECDKSDCSLHPQYKPKFGSGSPPDFLSSGRHG